MTVSGEAYMSTFKKIQTIPMSNDLDLWPWRKTMVIINTTSQKMNSPTRIKMILF
jgi:hypothetical protein